MFNSRLKKELQKLRDEFDQYKYDQENKPKYKVGDKLKDNSIIVNVIKHEYPKTIILGLTSSRIAYPVKYFWQYKAVNKGKIINI